MSETIVPYQKWCGQTQPHVQHIWADIKSNSIGLNLNCAGFSCLKHIDKESEGAVMQMERKPSMTVPEKHQRPPGEALCENCYTGAEEDTAS